MDYAYTSSVQKQSSKRNEEYPHYTQTYRYVDNVSCGYWISQHYDDEMCTE